MEERSIQDKINIINCGISWIHGSVVFKNESKYSHCFFGVCHLSNLIFAITPEDWEKATMIKSIAVSPSTGYCEKAEVCLNFDCRANPPWIFKLNKFNKFRFASEFKDAGPFSLGLPRDMGEKTLWFNEGNYKHLWKVLVDPYKPEGMVMYPKDGIIKNE